MKRLLLAALYFAGVAHIARFLNKNSLTILLYHGVAPRVSQGLYNYRGKFIAPEDFEMQMRYFKKHYRILELDDALARLKTGTLPPYSLVFTFDDGYRNFYAYAYPILSKLGVPATMFLAIDFVLGKKPLWVDRLEYAGSYAGDALKSLSGEERGRRVAEIEREAGVSFLDFKDDRAVYAPLALDEIREMQSAGIRFGAHTRSHPILSRIPREYLDEEIVGSKRALEAVGIRVSRTFAYPNGRPEDWNYAVEETVTRAGFSAALTTVEGTNTAATHPMRLKRIAMDCTDSSLAFASIAANVRGLLRGVLRKKP